MALSESGSKTTGVETYTTPAAPTFGGHWSHLQNRRGSRFGQSKNCGDRTLECLIERSFELEIWDRHQFEFAWPFLVKESVHPGVMTLDISDCATNAVPCLEDFVARLYTDETVSPDYDNDGVRGDCRVRDDHDID